MRYFFIVKSALYCSIEYFMYFYMYSHILSIREMLANKNLFTYKTSGMQNVELRLV